ncbi:MAG: hypothetical protein WBK55_02315 [Alphaproteobacteria bacterium]
MKDLFGHNTSMRDIDGETYNGRIVLRSADAILFNEGEREFWLPISQVRISNESPAPKGVQGKMATVQIPDWLARKHKLIGEKGDV